MDVEPVGNLRDEGTDRCQTDTNQDDAALCLAIYPRLLASSFKRLDDFKAIYDTLVVNPIITSPSFQEFYTASQQRWCVIRFGCCWYD